MDLVVVGAHANVVALLHPRHGRDVVVGARRRAQLLDVAGRRVPEVHLLCGLC